MIFDRTKQDVAAALSVRAEKVQNGEVLTDVEINTLERGMITVNTLNRIESKQAELRGLFNDMGYLNTSVINKVWDYTQIFDEWEFHRILENLKILCEAFFVYSDTPTVPPAQYHFENINSIEKILFDLEAMINDVKNYYRECGTFESGEE